MEYPTFGPRGGDAAPSEHLALARQDFDKFITGAVHAFNGQYPGVWVSSLDIVSTEVSDFGSPDGRRLVLLGVKSKIEVVGA